MTPAQMASDVEIGSSFFSSKGGRVYSYSGALVIALHVALPLAALGWLLAGMSQGGWKIDKWWIIRWRWRWLSLAAVVGLAVYLLLPKVEVEAVRQPSRYDGEASAQRTPPSGASPVSPRGHNTLSLEPRA